MPYQTKDKNCKPTEKLPKHLAHKPVFAIPYQAFDGIYSKGTDIRFISVGLSQYSDNEHVSIKTMRHTGNRWSRQSEEIPLHRAIDIVNFLARVLYDEKDGAITIPAGTFERQEKEIIVTDEGRKEQIREYFKGHADLYLRRFQSLKAILNRLIPDNDALNESSVAAEA